MEKESRPPERIFALSNFNPIALLGLIVLIISIVLAGVSLGLDRWSSQKVVRGSDMFSADSSTTKTQGVIQRCVTYVLSAEVLNLPSDERPSDKKECMKVSSVNCSAELEYLPSGQDSIDVNELENVDNTTDCESVKSNLSISCVLMIVGIIATFVAVVLYFPLWHRIVFVISAIVSLIGVLCYGLAVGLFYDTDSDYAGFFSVNGVAENGCLDYSFGLTIGSFILNLSGAIFGCLAFCFYYTKNKSKNE